MNLLNNMSETKLQQYNVTDFEQKIFDNLPKEKQYFVISQLKYTKTGPMKGQMFMPFSGNCYSCGKDIITYYLENEKNSFVTGCPFCNQSFCD